MSSNKRRPIGVFDSGVGGLTVLRKLAELLPNEDLLYLGDTARVPYGDKSPEKIRLYAQQCALFLLEQSVKLMVVACNTVSAVALEAIEEISTVPVVGTIKPCAEAATRCIQQGRIGIIGTRATVQSKSYEKEILRLNDPNKVSIFAQECPLFVPLAEEGWHGHPATYAIAKEYLTPLQKAKIECLILGCTHYPMLKKVIQEIMGGVRLIDSGEESALVARSILQSQSQMSSAKTRKIECWATDLTPTFASIVYQFLGLPASALHQVPLDLFVEERHPK